MFTKIKNRLVRGFGFTLCVILLAAILSGALCGLNAANISAQEQYEFIRKTTPIKLIVTDLTGTNPDALEAPDFAFRVFKYKGVENNLVPYVKDLQMKISIQSSYMYLQGVPREDTNFPSMVGITDLDISGQLVLGGQELVTWFDGYDATILSGWDYYCLIPESWLPEDVDLSQPLLMDTLFENYDVIYGAKTAAPVFTVVGTHRGPNSLVYCPYLSCKNIFTNLGKSAALDRLQATLVDNDLLEEAREVSKAWFAEPNPSGERTPWRYSWYFFYPNALVFDDTQVVTAAQTLKLSVMTNEICAWLIFILSACASFFVGFLIIRSRKKELLLMRTLGTPNWRIILELAIEQLLCLGAGVALGGVAFQWQPLERIGIFAGVYALGLTLAMIIFMNSNLLANLKEAE